MEDRDRGSPAEDGDGQPTERFVRGDARPPRGPPGAAPGLGRNLGRPRRPGAQRGGGLGRAGRPAGARRGGKRLREAHSPLGSSAPTGLREQGRAPPESVVRDTATGRAENGGGPRSSRAGLGKLSGGPRRSLPLAPALRPPASTHRLPPPTLGRTHRAVRRLHSFRGILARALPRPRGSNAPAPARCGPAPGSSPPPGSRPRRLAPAPLRRPRPLVVARAPSGTPSAMARRPRKPRSHVRERSRPSSLPAAPSNASSQSTSRSCRRLSPRTLDPAWTDPRKGHDPRDGVLASR